MGELFKYLVNAFIGRTRVPATLVIEGAYILPEEAKISLYRIARRH